MAFFIGTTKKASDRTRFEDCDALVVATKQWLSCVGPEFNCAGIRHLKGIEIMWRSDILFLKNIATS
jgi:hypothetical protein